MGCDIHMYLERKIDDGEWHIHPEHKKSESDGYIVDNPELTVTHRHYDLFAKLAGVRGHGPQPKGVPDDVSPEVEDVIEDYGLDGHSHSWISIEEFEKILNKLKFKPTDETTIIYNWNLFNINKSIPGYTPIVAFCKKETEELQVDSILLDSKPINVQYRLVFFFDN